MNARAAVVGRAAILPLVFFAGWECLARAHVTPDSLSRPSTIALALAAEFADGSLFTMVGQTLYAAVAGWALGSAMAIAAGVTIGTLPVLRLTVGPALELMRSIPPVALIPVALLAFGLGPKLEILMVAFSVFWPVVIFTTSGVRSIDPRVLEVARALRFSPAERIVRFVLPAASARIAVGLRVAAGIALVVAVTTEIIANPSGIGYGIAFSATTLRPDLMLADLLVLAVLGFGANGLLVALEYRFFGWARA
ncbi:MAG: ABC transporter permease [Candidatus Velthaea sp.]|jgi:NitT/TauT family transport system permease protein